MMAAAAGLHIEPPSTAQKAKQTQVRLFHTSFILASYPLQNPIVESPQTLRDVARS
jgi:hypothetical protein